MTPERLQWLTDILVRRWWLHIGAMALICFLMIAMFFQVQSIERKLDNGGEEWRQRLDKVQEDLKTILKSHEERLWTLQR